MMHRDGDLRLELGKHFLGRAPAPGEDAADGREFNLDFANALISCSFKFWPSRQVRDAQ